MKLHSSRCLHGAEFAEYDGDDNNTPLHSIVPDRQSLAHCLAALQGCGQWSWRCSVLAAVLSLASCFRVRSQITSDFSALSLSWITPAANVCYGSYHILLGLNDLLNCRLTSEDRIDEATRQRIANVN